MRAFSAQIEQVPPAATYKDVQDEWYLRQRSQISLGNRLPHVAVSAWIAPSAVVVGDVDLLDRVRAACLACSWRSTLAGA